MKKTIILTIIALAWIFAIQALGEGTIEVWKWDDEAITGWKMCSSLIFFASLIITGSAWTKGNSK